MARLSCRLGMSMEPARWSVQILVVTKSSWRGTPFCNRLAYGDIVAVDLGGIDMAVAQLGAVRIADAVAVSPCRRKVPTPIGGILCEHGFFFQMGLVEINDRQRWQLGRCR